MDSSFNKSHNLGVADSKLVLENETYVIVGVAMEIYYKLGNGFAEPVYQEAMEIEFGLRRIPFEREKYLSIEYKGRTLNKQYKADFVCFGQVIVELKSVTQLSPVDWSQVLNYLKVSDLRIGLLFNFGSVGRLEQKRMII